MYNVYTNNANVYINSPTPSTPPPQQKMIVSPLARAISSSNRNHSQKAVMSSQRATTDRYIEIIPYDGSRGSSDNQRVQKVLGKLGSGVISWKVSSDGKLTVSTVQHTETIINALKCEFSSNRRITILTLQKTGVVGSRSAATFQDNRAFQAMGRVVASHASQGLLTSVEYQEISTTKDGTTQARAMKVNYVNRDGGRLPSGSRGSAAPAPSVPRTVVHGHGHATGRRVGFTTTTSNETSRSKQTSRSYH